MTKMDKEYIERESVGFIFLFLDAILEGMGYFP